MIGTLQILLAREEFLQLVWKTVGQHLGETYTHRRRNPASSLLDVNSTKKQAEIHQDVCGIIAQLYRWQSQLETGPTTIKIRELQW